MNSGFFRPANVGMKAALMISFLVNFLLCGSYRIVNPSSLKQHRSLFELCMRPTTSPSDWYSVGDCLVLLPDDKIPRSIIHFIGGFVAGSAVPLAYSGMLGHLAEKGHLIVATPIPVFAYDHSAIAMDISKAFDRCYYHYIRGIVGPAVIDVPIIGLSHSLGGKLMALVGSHAEEKLTTKRLPDRRANIYLAFNNYDLLRSIELSRSQARKVSPQLESFFNSISWTENARGAMDAIKRSPSVVRGLTGMIGNLLSSTDSTIPSDEYGFSDAIKNALRQPMERVKNAIEEPLKDVETIINDLQNFEFEFSPSPEDTWRVVRNGYNVYNNVIIKFADDEIDESVELASRLRRRQCRVDFRVVPGTHITPNIAGTGTAGDNGSSNCAEFLFLLSTVLRQISAEDGIVGVDGNVRASAVAPQVSPSDKASMIIWDGDDDY